MTARPRPLAAPRSGNADLDRFARDVQEALVSLEARLLDYIDQRAEAGDAPALSMEVLTPPLAQTQAGMVQLYARRLVLQKGRDPYLGTLQPAGTIDVRRIVSDAGGGGGGGTSTTTVSATNRTIVTGWATA